LVNTIIKKITVGVPIRGVTSGAFAITNLGGVDVTSVGEGDMLVYDASQSKFIADSDTYLKTTDSAEVKAMFSAGGDLTYNSSSGQFTIDVEAIYTQANFDSDLDAATAAGSIAFNDGTASLPSIANTGDTNTGFHFPAADKIGFTVGGASQFTVSDGVISPVTDNDVDLGTSSLEFKDLYLDGTARIDTLFADSANIAGKLDVTGNLEANTVNADGDTSAGQNAAMGYTAAEGLILTGQGSTNDVTIKNDADAAVIQIPTGTTGVTMTGTLGVTGKITADAGVDIDNFNIDGTTIALSSGDMTLDAAGDIILDADGGDVFFKDAGTIFGSATNASGNLIIKSGTTTALTFSGANVTAAGAATFNSTITTTALISGGSLDIDNVLIDGATIGHTDDTDLITLANGLVTVAGEISVTTLDIGGTNVAATATELNVMDGGTSASSTTVADGDRVVLNDAGTS